MESNFGSALKSAVICAREDDLLFDARSMKSSVFKLDHLANFAKLSTSGFFPFPILESDDAGTLLSSATCFQVSVLASRSVFKAA